MAAGGYMVMAGVTTKYVFDLQPGDVYWCTADCGWITGHTYLTYGPLLNGAQNVIFEGVPTYPDPSRCWGPLVITFCKLDLNVGARLTMSRTKRYEWNARKRAGVLVSKVRSTELCTERQVVQISCRTAYMKARELREPV